MFETRKHFHLFLVAWLGFGACQNLQAGSDYNVLIQRSAKVDNKLWAPKAFDDDVLNGRLRNLAEGISRAMPIIDKAVSSPVADLAAEVLGRIIREAPDAFSHIDMGVSAVEELVSDGPTALLGMLTKLTALVSQLQESGGGLPAWASELSSALANIRPETQEWTLRKASELFDSFAPGQGHEVKAARLVLHLASHAWGTSNMHPQTACLARRLDHSLKTGGHSNLTLAVHQLAAAGAHCVCSPTASSPWAIVLRRIAAHASPAGDLEGVALQRNPEDMSLPLGAEGLLRNVSAVLGISRSAEETGERLLGAAVSFAQESGPAGMPAAMRKLILDMSDLVKSKQRPFDSPLSILGSALQASENNVVELSSSLGIEPTLLRFAIAADSAAVGRDFPLEVATELEKSTTDWLSRYFDSKDVPTVSLLVRRLQDIVSQARKGADTGDLDRAMRVMTEELLESAMQNGAGADIPRSFKMAGATLLRKTIHLFSSSRFGHEVDPSVGNEPLPQDLYKDIRGLFAGKPELLELFEHVLTAGIMPRTAAGTGMREFGKLLRLCFQAIEAEPDLVVLDVAMPLLKYIAGQMESGVSLDEGRVAQLASIALRRIPGDNGLMSGTEIQSILDNMVSILHNAQASDEALRQVGRVGGIIQTNVSLLQEDKSDSALDRKSLDFIPAKGLWESSKLRDTWFAPANGLWEFVLRDTWHFIEHTNSFSWDHSLELFDFFMSQKISCQVDFAITFAQFCLAGMGSYFLVFGGANNNEPGSVEYKRAQIGYIFLLVAKVFETYANSIATTRSCSEELWDEKSYSAVEKYVVTRVMAGMFFTVYAGFMTNWCETSVMPTTGGFGDFIPLTAFAGFTLAQIGVILTPPRHYSEYSFYGVGSGDYYMRTFQLFDNAASFAEPIFYIHFSQKNNFSDYKGGSRSKSGNGTGLTYTQANCGAGISNIVSGVATVVVNSLGLLQTRRACQFLSTLIEHHINSRDEGEVRLTNEVRERLSVSDDSGTLRNGKCHRGIFQVNKLVLKGDSADERCRTNYCQLYPFEATCKKKMTAQELDIPGCQKSKEITEEWPQLIQPPMQQAPASPTEGEDEKPTSKRSLIAPVQEFLSACPPKVQEFLGKWVAKPLKYMATEVLKMGLFVEGGLHAWQSGKWTSAVYMMFDMGVWLVSSPVHLLWFGIDKLRPKNAGTEDIPD